MRANRAKDTSPEIALRRALWRAGNRNYRVAPKRVPGTPDILFPRARVAVFVNGCFWHRCPRCALPLPKSNRSWWAEKFERNVERDARKARELEASDFRVLTVWECEVSEDVDEVVSRIAALAGQTGGPPPE